MDMCPASKVTLSVYVSYVSCVHLSVSLMEMCPVLKLHFLVYLFHGYVPCPKVTLLCVSVSWRCAQF